MAWENCEIVIADATIKGSIKRSDEKTMIQCSYVEDVSNGDEISVDGKKLIIKSAQNIGARDEQLLLEIENDKSVQRGTRSKARKSDTQDEVDS